MVRAGALLRARRIGAQLVFAPIPWANTGFTPYANTPRRRTPVSALRLQVLPEPLPDQAALAVR